MKQSKLTLCAKNANFGLIIVRDLAAMLCFTIILLGIVNTANAQIETNSVYIKVGEANLQKSLLAITPFQLQGTPATTKNHIQVGTELFETVKNDLTTSNYFELMNPKSNLEKKENSGLRPAPAEQGFKFDDWKQQETKFLIRCGYKILQNELTFETYLYFVPQAKTVMTKTYKAKVSDVRTVAHTFANDIIKELTGQTSMFLTRVVTSRSVGKEIKEIFVMDWDGNNPQQITNHKSFAVSPTWSPDGKHIAYTYLALHANDKTRNWDLFSYDLTSGVRSLVSYQKGRNSGAAYMPDGKQMLLTIDSAGNPDIYRMTVEGKGLIRLTNGPRGAMNVEPAISPDGKKIAFSSDRSGKPMIYVMNVDGSNVIRLTHAGEYNSMPNWSPDSKRLVFAGFDKDHYDIFSVDADGTNMLRLTTAKKSNGKMADNEYPSYSPDGRHILFVSNRTGLNQLYLTDLSGEYERRITFDRNEYFQPKWSPFLN